MTDLMILILVVAGLVAIVLFFTIAGVVVPYIVALRADARISLFELIGMRLRKVKVGRIVRARIAAKRAGLDIPTSRLEVHILMGGDPQAAVELMASSQRSRQPLTWDDASKQQLGQATAGESPPAATQDARTHHPSLLSLWIQVLLSNAGPLGFGQLIRMRTRMRKGDLVTVLYSRIRSVKAGMPIPIEALEAHSKAGGKVASIISAMILSRKINVDLSWEEATAMDLAGDDVLALMQDVENDPAKAKRTGAEPVA